MKLFYQELREQIEQNTTVQHVRLWNNQINLSEKGEQIPYQLPGVFIDFPNIEWATLSKGTLTCTLITRLYIVFESFTTDENEEDLDMFDLRDEVYLAVTNFKPTQSTKLMRTTEQTDPNHTNTYVWTMDFTCQYNDIAGVFPRNSTTANITEFILDKDLQINVTTIDGIRTDSEIV